MASQQPVDLIGDVGLLLAVDHEKDEIQVALCHAAELHDAIDAAVPVDVPFHDDLGLACMDLDVFLVGEDALDFGVKLLDDLGVIVVGVCEVVGSFLQRALVFINVRSDPLLEVLDVLLMPGVGINPLVCKLHPQAMLGDHNNPCLFQLR